jgi:hypothetical protein
MVNRARHDQRYRCSADDVGRRNNAEDDDREVLIGVPAEHLYARISLPNDNGRHNVFTIIRDASITASRLFECAYCGMYPQDDGKKRR